MNLYSPFFQTLYDQPTPVGHFGRGTHYSVLRCVTWKDSAGKRMYPAGHQDFAVVWDEDHDTRVIQAIEELYRKEMLHGVQFIGERKGGLTIVVSEDFRSSLSDAQFEIYQSDVAAIAGERPEDVWTSNVETRRQPSDLINESPERCRLYLDSIDLLWRLGCKASK